jgi:acyl-CoA thioesterase-1
MRDALVHVRRPTHRLTLAALLVLATGCSRDAVPEVGEPAARPAAAPDAPSMRAAGPPSDPGLEPRIDSGFAPDDAPLVVFLGDSLTAGFGLGEEQAFPALVGEELARRGTPVRVINGGISGDTTAGGLERLDWLLAQEPDLVLVELGANDGLRGQPLEAIEANLRAIVERARASGAEVMLAGMRIPPSYGPEYAAGFEAIFPKLAREQGVALIPFLLDGVAARPELNLPDGIHPNVEGQKIVARSVADALGPLLADLGSEERPAA